MEMSDDFRLLQLFNQLSESDKNSVFDFVGYLANRQTSKQNLSEENDEQSEELRKSLEGYDFSL